MSALPSPVSSFRTDLRSEYDADAPLGPAEAAARHPVTGRAMPVTERVAEILDGIEAAHGAFGRTPKAAACWREAFRVHMTRALAAIPLLLARPHPRFRYLLLGPERAAGLHDSGLLVVLSFDRLDWLKGGTIPQDDLVACPDSALHWDRPMRCVPVSDPAACDPERAPHLARLLAVMADLAEQKLKGGAIAIGLDDLYRPYRSPRTHKAVIPAEVYQAAGYRGRDTDKAPPLPTACWAAGRVLRRVLLRTANAAFTCALRRLLDADVVREARRFGDRDVYWWLAAVDVAGPTAPEVSRRRRQFARAYPELVVALQSVARGYGLGRRLWNRLSRVARQAGQDERTLMAAIARAVDDAAPVGPLVKTLRGWPGWVERALRGRLTPGRGKSIYHSVDAYAPPIDYDTLDRVARALDALGPAWRPRRDDDLAMGALVRLADDLRLDPRDAIGSACAAPGRGASPWKQVWKRMPEALRAGPPRRQRGPVLHDTRRWLTQTAQDVRDMIAAFDREVALPLLPPDGMADLRAAHETTPDLHVLSRTSLPVLLALSAEWHGRLEAIERAKTARAVKDDGAATWPALFAPFSLIRSRVEVVCVTDQAALQAHGKAMGHCVGGYAWNCLTGPAHIVAFAVGGAFVATAHFDLEPTPGGGFCAALKQARGRANGELPPEAEDALAELRAVLPGAPVRLDDRCPALDGLAVADPTWLDTQRAQRYAEREHLKAVAAAGYDVADPEAVERVLVAWRFAMPDKMRAAWEKGRGAEERVANVRAWLRAWAAGERTRAKKAARAKEAAWEAAARAQVTPEGEAPRLAA